jgi:hypothetical protein
MVFVCARNERRPLRRKHPAWQLPSRVDHFVEAGSCHRTRRGLRVSRSSTREGSCQAGCFLLKGRLSLRAHTKTIACKFSCHWASVRCYIIRSSPSPSLRQARGPARARPNSCSQPGDGSRQRWPFRRSRSRAAAGATQSGRRGSCALRRRPHRTVRGGENRERMGEWLKDGVPTQREWGKLTKPLPFSGWP